MKHFISNAGFADFLVVFAKTDPQAGARGISAFVLEVAHTPGITFSAPEPTMQYLRARLLLTHFPPPWDR